jgi:Zn-dependent peptidase ImmA (M78 family)/transcriptional regulator with XRE-family HTH domain
MAGRTPSAIVEPAVLVWARRSVSMTTEQAAKRLGQSLERVIAWEAGEASPTMAQLRKMSDVYKRPLAVFFLAGPPRDFDALHDFRRLAAENSEAWTPALHFEYRRANDQRASAVEVAQRINESIPTSWQPKTPIGRDDPEQLGHVLRTSLGVTLKEQSTWTEKYRALGGWIRALEDNGVLVIQTEKIDLQEMRGFSIYADEYPVIAVNGTDFVRGKVFSLLHEYAHLALRQSSLCDQISDSQPRTSDRRLEAYCNQAAASALMPAEALLSEPLVDRAPKGYERWDSEVLGTLSRTYGVSEEAVLRRLLTLGKTTRRYYQQRREEFLALYERERVQQKESQKDKPGGPTYYRVRARNLGKGYVRLVSHAYARDAIDTLEAASYLGVKVQHITKLADEAFGRAG